MNSLILPYINRGCMQLFPDEVSARYPAERIMMVLDDTGCLRDTALWLVRMMH